MTPPLSARAKDFIQACLRHRAGARPTVDQLLQHPWIVEYCWEASETARRMGDLSQQLITCSDATWSDLLDKVDGDAARRVKAVQR